MDGGINTYGYALQNPINYFDPNGATAIHAGRLAFGAGTRIGAAVNYAIQATAGASLGILLYEAINEVNDAADSGTDEPDQCDDDEKCEKAKRKARSIYNNLVNKRIPQFLSGGTRGRDSNHRNTISQKQQGLRNAIRRVRANCKVLPPELQEWERVANMSIPEI